MDAATVQKLLDKQLQGCEFQVQGEGANYDITVIGDLFEGLRPVKKGNIHAVNIRTYTPAEWQALNAD